MKVLGETTDRLTLGDRPWLLGLAIAAGAVATLGVSLSYLLQGDIPGALMAALGFLVCLLAFASFVRRTIVFLDRPTGRVVVRVASVFGQSETSAALAEVLRAEVDTKQASNSDDQDTHRPILRLANGGTLILRETLVSGGGAARVVEVVNRWLGQNRPSA